MNDTPDPADEPLPLPVRRTSVPPVSPQYDPADDAYGHHHDPSGSTGKKVSAALLWRGLRRYWWQAFLVWIVGSSGLVALAYYKIKPSYDAAACIRVEHGDLTISDPNGNSRQVDFDQYMVTQVSLVTSPPVLATALAKHPELKNLPLLKDSLDPQREIASMLRVGVRPPRTVLIDVQMSSQTQNEAAQIVNAVVDAYLKNALLTHDTSNQKYIDHLKESRIEYAEKVATQRKVIQKLQDSIGEADVKVLRDRDVASIDQYKEMSTALTKVEIQRISERAKLDQLRNERVEPAQKFNPEDLKAKVIQEFYFEPRVEAVQFEVSRQEKALKEAERIAQNRSDPAVRMRRERVKEAVAKRNELWIRLEPEITRRLTVPQTDAELDAEIRRAERNLDAVVVEENELRAKLDKLRVEGRKDRSAALQLEYASRDLETDQRALDRITENLNDREFSARNPIARMSTEYEASPSIRPDSNRRIQAMAAAPVGMGLLVLGMLALLEMRGARVGDPDELVSRINLQVIGVVPPLPQVRHMAQLSNGNGNGHANGNGNGHAGAGEILSASDFRARRQLDEFVQSLDHLRVALCARRDPWGRDRHCVLITSACGSEGKTTLAAQLAERCVNAGLMTLLIDADLRNPTLSRMLDATENPGLINVLRGEVDAEDVVAVIGDAGGFHLLPAGTPRMDPSRLLQSERLGSLIAQARESFDMIIIDAPPVLPVPDALTIGRWTDGAVLAVRYDTSRFPLVEKAHRRLSHVGVPVIGAVVNGVKSMESAYGYGGYYAYGSSSNGSPSSGS